MPVRQIATSVALFVLAGLCEIGGGWLVWQWFREGKGFTWGLLGAAVLILLTLRNLNDSNSKLYSSTLIH